MIVLAALALAVVTGQTSPSGLPECRRLAVSLDDQGGAFDGMSHSGALLILRNTGPVACRVPGLPTVSFHTRSGRKLPVARAAPPGMHPGPVVVPVTLAPGSAASTALRWVSGNVIDHGRCLTPAKLSVQAGARPLSLPFGRQLCGPSDAPATFDQPVLQAGDGAPR